MHTNINTSHACQGSTCESFLRVSWSAKTATFCRIACEKQTGTSDDQLVDVLMHETACWLLETGCRSGSAPLNTLNSVNIHARTHARTHAHTHCNTHCNTHTDRQTIILNLSRINTHAHTHTHTNTITSLLLPFQPFYYSPFDAQAHHRHPKHYVHVE